MVTDYKASFFKKLEIKFKVDKILFFCRFLLVKSVCFCGLPPLFCFLDVKKEVLRSYGGCPGAAPHPPASQHPMTQRWETHSPFLPGLTPWWKLGVKSLQCTRCYVMYSQHKVFNPQTNRLYIICPKSHSWQMVEP